jgi:hypothetical protein
MLMRRRSGQNMKGMKTIAMLAGRESALMTKTACIEGLGTFLAPQSKIRKHWIPALGAVLGFTVGMIGEQLIA